MLNDRSKEIRRKMIKNMLLHSATHFGGSLSCLEILINLYDKILTKDDIFILSKGHCCWGLYELLKEKGLTPKESIEPDLDVSNGIYATSGSLGHGFPFGLGIALAKKIKNEKGKVYILMGDGECQEGTTWESLLIANAKNITNIIVIIDNNKIQGCDYTKNILPIDNLNNIVENCGWMCKIIDGHNNLEIYENLTITTNKPLCIIANTIKGKGISFMENDPIWHSKIISPELEKKILFEIQ